MTWKAPADLRLFSFPCIIPALLAGLLAGCAITPSLDAWQPPDATDISEWRMSGRVSLTRDGEGWHARLAWEEQDERFELEVSGPLGQGRFRLSGDPQGILLEQSDGKKTRAPNADLLVLQMTGWSLPVGGLRYWVRGLPVPGVAARASRDLQGRLVELEQSGWSVTYSRYKLVNGIGWPAKLSLARDDVSLRLVIDDWHPGAVSGSGS